MTEKEIKSLIGAATYKQIEAYARKLKKEGRHPAEVKKALMAKFGNCLLTVNSALILSQITKPPGYRAG